MSAWPLSRRNSWFPAIKAAPAAANQDADELLKVVQRAGAVCDERVRRLGRAVLPLLLLQVRIVVIVRVGRGGGGGKWPAIATAGC